MAPGPAIVTPDRRLRVFISSTLEELAAERVAVRRAVTRLHLVPVMFEAGARSHPPRSLYRAYLDQSDVFVGVYWERYGWVAPDMTVSGLEDEYLLSAGKARLVYVKRPAPGREPRLGELLDRMRDDGDVSYKPFSAPAELERLVCDDLAILLTERFQATIAVPAGPARPAVHPLPADTTSFVGRAAELDEVVTVLRDSGARCVTLTGTGGIGKTRLAVQAARRVEREFADGACFVPLADVSGAIGLLRAMAAALGLRDAGTEPLAAVIGDHLGRLDMLVVLDGFEHLVDAADVVVELLERAPQAKLLVTSRAALRILAEHVIDVPPLAVAAGRHATAEELASGEAVQLFLARASAARHGYNGAGDEETIATICRRLDGIPLAIELAAAAVRLLPPRALLERLAHRLEMPVAGPRDMPERHRTLREAIASSYRLCTDAEKALLARMAVFAGGCSLAAAESVCAPGGEIDVLATAGSLVEESLLRAHAGRGDLRFAMLETIREYALERLDERGEVEAVGGRHAAWFRDLALEMDRGLRGPCGAQWLARLRDQTAGGGDADNIRAALRWYVAHGCADDAATMIWALWMVTWATGSIDEGRETTRAVLATGDAMSPVSRARTTATLGYLEMWKGNYGEAVPLLNEALSIARTEHDEEAVGHVLLALGIVAAPVQGEQRAKELIRASLDSFAACADTWGQGAAMAVLGWLHVALDEHDDDQLFADASAVAARVGDPLLVAITDNNLADHELHLGNLGAARRAMDRALAGYRELRAEYPAAYGVETAARIADLDGRTEMAAVLTGAADSMRDRIGVPVWGGAQRRRGAFLAALEERLGSRRFDDARTAGRGLRFDDVLDLATSALQPHTQPQPR